VSERVRKILRSKTVACLLVGGLLAAAAPVWACDVPVFRYALERWPAAPYGVCVFHRGPMSAEAQAAVDQLRKAGRCDEPDGFLGLLVVDLATLPAADAAAPAPAEGAAAGEPVEARPAQDGVQRAVAAIWKRQPKDATLPWMVVRYPRDADIPEDAWAGPLDAPTVAALVDSPARRKVARAILGGDSGVFVLLESGDRAKDDAAATVVETTLKEMAEALKLPVPDGGWDDPVYDASGPPPGLRVAFSMVRVSRSDPAERLFVRMLLDIDADLAGATAPALFPIFGRGRLLGGVTGERLTDAVVEQACEFLVGPCSCIVKDANPGVDMLMAVDWDAALDGEESAIPKVEPPPLTGVADFVPGQAGEGAAEGGTALVRNIVLAAGGGIVIVAVAAVVLWRRAQRT
jgi:hypothetical protein